MNSSKINFDIRNLTLKRKDHNQIFSPGKHLSGRNFQDPLWILAIYINVSKNYSSASIVISEQRGK